MLCDLAIWHAAFLSCLTSIMVKHSTASAYDCRPLIEQNSKYAEE